MGYRSGSNHADDRDKEFERSFQENGVSRQQARKKLDSLFSDKPKKTEDLCKTEGHSYIRDRDGVTKCHRCKTPRPTEA